MLKGTREKENEEEEVTVKKREKEASSAGRETKQSKRSLVLYTFVTVKKRTDLGPYTRGKRKTTDAASKTWERGYIQGERLQEFRGEKTEAVEDRVKRRHENGGKVSNGLLKGSSWKKKVAGKGPARRKAKEATPEKSTTLTVGGRTAQ